MKIAILTDSSFDGDVKKIDNLYSVPLMITTEDGQTIKDDENLTKEVFWDLLKHNTLKTSQTIPSLILEKFDTLLKEYDQVLFIGISSGLSGQYNTVNLLINSDEKYKDKVFAIESRGVSTVLQKMIQEISKWIKEGKTIQEIMELYKGLNSRFTTFIIPRNLETLKRGGRVSPAVNLISRVLRIYAILRYHGEIDKETIAKTFKRAIKEAISLIKKERPNIKKISISYSKLEKIELETVLEIVKNSGLEIDILSELTNVISVHTGFDTISITGWEE